MDGVKSVINLKNEKFFGKLFIKEPKTAILQTQKNKSDLSLWLDRSQPKSRKISIIVVLRDIPGNR